MFVYCSAAKFVNILIQQKRPVFVLFLSIKGGHLLGIKAVKLVDAMGVRKKILSAEEKILNINLEKSIIIKPKKKKI